MSELSALAYKLSKLKDDLKKYEKEIDRLNGEIPDIINQLKEDGSGVDLANILDMSGKGVSPRTSKPGEIIDYSVTMEDLKEYDSVSLSDGNSYTIYSCDRTGALYIIGDKKSLKDNVKKKELYASLKDKIGPDQMVIVTFNGKEFKGDVHNPQYSTRDFALVAKNQDGKMFTFYNGKGDIAKVPKKEPLVLYKGLALPSHGNTYVESGTTFDFDVIYQNENRKGVLDKQAGLCRCCLFVQKREMGASSNIGQDTKSEFIINDPVLENACYRLNKKEQGLPCYLDASNGNRFDKKGGYHLIFSDSIEEYEARWGKGKAKYNERDGFIGTCDNVIPVTLNTYSSNEDYWNSYNFTLEGVNMNGRGGHKQVWGTLSSYCVDDWDDIVTLNEQYNYPPTK